MYVLFTNGDSKIISICKHSVDYSTEWLISDLFPCSACVIEYHLFP